MQACEDVHEVDYINGTSADEVNQLYIQRNIPVIVKDAMIDWPVMKDSFTILNLTDVSSDFKFTVSKIL